MSLPQWAAGNPAWQTILFTALAFGQVAQAFAVRGGSESIVRTGVLGNRVLLVLAAAVAGLQVAAVYAPPMRAFLGTVALSPAEIASCVAAAVFVLAGIEVGKLTGRRRKHARDRLTTPV